MTGTTTEEERRSAGPAARSGEAAVAAVSEVRAHLGSRAHGDAARARRVHQARKQLKLLRALVRSWRAIVPGPTRRILDHQARDLARALSGARDEVVLCATATSLGLDPAALGLGAGQDAPWRPEVLASLRRDAVTLAHAVQAVAPTEGGFSVLAPGLEHTWREGRRGARACSSRPEADDLHEWRKAVKARMLQERLFVSAWPEVLGPSVQALDELQELLGAHHDLHVLAERIAARGEIARRVKDRQRELEARALYLGARLYAGSPGGWSRLLGGWVSARWPEP